MALEPKLSHVEYSIDMTNASEHEREAAKRLGYDKQFLATPRGLASALALIKKIEYTAGYLRAQEADSMQGT